MATPSRAVINASTYTKVIDNKTAYLLQNTETITVSIIGNMTDSTPSPGEVGYLITYQKAIGNADLIDKTTSATCPYVFAKVINGEENTNYTMST